MAIQLTAWSIQTRDILCESDQGGQYFEMPGAAAMWFSAVQRQCLTGRKTVACLKWCLSFWIISDCSSSS